ncbi:MAG: polysaccharide biosynthesis tyrosine autokinase [Planctomycetota bacterium]
MTTAASHPRPTSPAPMRAAAPPAAGSGAAFDPIKVFQKYLLVLILAGVVGVGVGIAGFFLLREFAPQYRSEAFFQVLPPRETIAEFGNFGSNKEELERFMATQANSMTSLNVLEAAINDPRLTAEASDWSRPFLDSSGRLKAADALFELQETVVARPMPNTEYIQLSFEYSKKQDVFTVVDVITEAYLEFLRRSTNEDRTDTRQQLNQLIDELNATVTNEQRSIDRLLAENQIESIDTRLSEAAQRLNLAVENLSSIQELITLAETQQQEFTRALNDPTGLAIPESIRGAVQIDPLIQQLQSQVQSLQARERGMERLGLGLEHPQRRALRADIDGVQEELTAKSEALMSTRFNLEIDSIRRQLAQLRARESELLTDIEESQDRLNELTGIGQEIASLDRSVQSTQERIAENEARLDELRGVSELDSASRVRLFQSARIPDKISFPDIKLILPAGFLLVMGLTAGVILLRELLDQRIKGPSDIAMIPRTPVLGMLPDVSEDPSRPKRAETAFHDRPSGVFAEGVRQLRVELARKTQQSGHRSVLVVPAMPKSGATSVVTNLAEASARAGSRVLIVDANLRRPAIHSLFGLEASPGLADLLAGSAEVDDVVCKTDTPTLDVITVGSAEHRVFERISTEPMRRVLTELESRYDLVILDVAPAIVAGDAVGLAGHVGSTILITRALNEKRGLIARLRNDFGNSRSEFLGVVVNGVRSSAGGYFKRNMRTAHAYQNHQGAGAEA